MSDILKAKDELYCVLDQVGREYMRAAGINSIHIEIDITQGRDTTVKIMDIIRK
ncbi:MAG: hypothetical protein WC374_13340 [Phycisphaerae bacterium]|jgi:hypothetical protein